jgi:hypothetical protein
MIQDHIPKLSQRYCSPPKYRFHIKLLLIQSIGFQDNPTQDEESIVSNRIFGVGQLERVFSGICSY